MQLQENNSVSSASSHLNADITSHLFKNDDTEKERKTDHVRLMEKSTWKHLIDKTLWYDEDMDLIESKTKCTMGMTVTVSSTTALTVTIETPHFFISGMSLCATLLFSWTPVRILTVKGTSRTFGQKMSCFHSALMVIVHINRVTVTFFICLKWILVLFPAQKSQHVGKKNSYNALHQITRSTLT